MRENRETILVVDDQYINRKVVSKQLNERYITIEAENGEQALDIVMKHIKIGVILLDLIMPVMNGFEFMEKLKEKGYGKIPVIVMTANDDAEMEEKAFKAGAVDFVKKPTSHPILMSRIENALIRNQMVMLQRMEYITSHDTLTQLYNRNKMFEETYKMVVQYPDIRFAFIRFDLDKFRLYNTAMGEKEGDKLLLLIADAVKKMSTQFAVCTYGRIDADVFCICGPYDEKRIETYLEEMQSELQGYRLDYSMKASAGICIIEDTTISIETTYTRASMAANRCKDKYDKFFAYYDSSMGDEIAAEQKIVSEMRKALDREEFEVYLQPKYELDTDLPCGAEALVRWNHPKDGMIAPGKFIPVFEKNGFITKLDYYMWEHVCMLLHRWLSEGKKVFPVSVNMSRISLFNRRVDEQICDLVNKYEIPPALLNLEITESAYMSNPAMMGEIIDKLHKKGFAIMMDDFGSGYSSLNTLKDIDIDILKLDMKFMPNGTENGKSERIVSSVVRMAGWLGMDVIAEGVETLEQKMFLEGIGCGYVQGFFYAKPMPVEEYEELMNCKMPEKKAESKIENEDFIDAIWSSNPQIREILSSIQIPVVILECASDSIDIIRTNQSYRKMYGSKAMNSVLQNLGNVDAKNINKVIKDAALNGMPKIHEFQYISDKGDCHWIRLRMQRISSITKSAIICCIIEEITKEKMYESKLSKLLGKFEVLADKKKMLVIDDLEVSRAVLKNMFTDKYEIIEAENGEEGLTFLKQYQKDIAIILLDILMPKMDGEAFLKYKNQWKEVKDIPVIVISSESDMAIQLGMLKNGVSDYIVKPFDFDVTKQRVENVLTYQSRFQQMVKEYKDITQSRSEK